VRKKLANKRGRKYRKKGKKIKTQIDMDGKEKENKLL
jgi:hypothetical protein